jgi:hypothetical protein
MAIKGKNFGNWNLRSKMREKISHGTQAGHHWPRIYPATGTRTLQ